MKEKMTKWEVAHIPIANGDGFKTVYQVFRRIDPTKIDHSGNREWGKLFYSEEEAVAEAARLNSERTKAWV